MRTPQGLDLFVQNDPLSFLSDIAVDWGSLTQTYDKETKTYYPDRSAVPLILRPWVKGYDESTGTAYPNITIQKIDWYYLEKGKRKELSRTGFNNRTNNSGEKILEIVENTPPDTMMSVGKYDYPSAITAVITFLDPRTGEELQREHLLQLSTAYGMTHQWRVELNYPASFRVDPTTIERTSENVAPLTLVASLHDNSSVIRDSNETVNTENSEIEGNVAYFWMYYDADTGTWKQFDSTCPWLISDASETLYGTVIVNVDFFDELRVRCYAQSYNDDDDVPEAPTKLNQFAETYIKRELPYTADANVIMDKFPMIKDVTSEEKIQMHVEMFDNRGPISNQDKYYAVDWYVKKHGSSVPSKIGSGSKLVKAIKDLGLTQAIGVSIYPVIYEVGAYKPTTTAAGQTADGFRQSVSAVTANGTFTLAQKIKK